jgi:hypothetical protein
MASAVTAPHGALSARAAVRGARATRRTVAPARRVNTTTRAAIVDPPKVSIKDVKRPDETGRFGDYGGKYVPETLIPALQALEKEYAALASDEQFQVRTRTRDRHTRLTRCGRFASRARARERRRATLRRASTRARSRRDRPYLSVEARFSQTEKTRR